jgi:Fur family peroxide stress response transcriptional regulator
MGPAASTIGEPMLTQHELVERLRQWEVRVTPQRLAIAEAVLNSTDHPTVQQIHERVRDHFPSMTLATIYSTLGVLQRSGLIQELPFQKMSRYEANMEPHVNLVCMNCEEVIDTDTGQDMVVRLKNRISRQSNFQVALQRVDFYGWCPRCANDRRERQLTD